MLDPQRKESPLAIAARSTVVLVAGAALALLATARAPSVLAATDNEIVAALYPDWLVKDVAPQEPERSSRYLRADLDGRGVSDYIVAVYYNGGKDALRVIHVQNGTGVVAADLDWHYLGGAQGFTQLRDVDGDGKPEIWLTIPGERTDQDWIFRWSQGGLALISPATADVTGRLRSDISSIELVDLDGDGKLEIVSEVRGGRPFEMSTYKLGASGAYVKGSDALVNRRYVRTEGTPEVDALALTASPGTYKVTIVNGDASGANKVTSADVTLNGKPVFTESDFKKAARIMRADVSLVEDNVLSIELRSAPGSKFAISVQKP